MLTTTHELNTLHYSYPAFSEYSGNSVPAANLNHAGLNFPAPVSSCVQFSFMPSEPMHSMPAACPPCPPRRPLVVENPLTEREPSHVVRWVADQNGGATFLDDGGMADTHSGPYPGRCPRRAAVQDGYSPAGYPAYFAGNDAFPQGCSAPLDEGTYLRTNRGKRGNLEFRALINVTICICLIHIVTARSF